VSSQHLVQHASERPDVGPFVEWPAARLFGAHIRGRTQNDPFACPADRDGRRLRQFRFGAVRGIDSGKPKIEYFDDAIRGDLDVCRLEIAVDDAFLVRRIECVGKLMGDRQGLTKRYRPASHPIGHRFTVDQFKDQRAYAVDVFDTVDGANVRMVERRQQVRFALEAAQPIGIVSEEVWQDLYRDVALESCVPSSIHFAHSADAEQRQHLVGA
jgi:hypothetical protein